MRNGSGNSPYAGPQPAKIAATADKLKGPKKKFEAPEKKTGVPKGASTSELNAASKMTAPAKKRGAKSGAGTISARKTRSA
jgi:hypothetical protein